MIKKIHYCWFGANMPDSIKRNIENWHTQNPDFEIIESNENNIDISMSPFAQRALEEGRWAFVSDIVRLQRLVDEGGVYLDCDIELVSPLSSLENESHKLIMGYMYKCALGTAAMYSPPNHPYIIDVLKRYEYMRMDLFPINNTIFTEYFINSVPNFLLTGKEWENEFCHIYPKEKFEQPAFIKSRGISIHHCCGSWKEHFQGVNDTPKSNFSSHYINWMKRKINTQRALRKNEFFEVYLAANKNLKLPFDTTKFYTQAPSN